MNSLKTGKELQVNCLKKNTGKIEILSFGLLAVDMEDLRNSVVYF